MQILILWKYCTESHHTTCKLNLPTGHYFTTPGIKPIRTCFTIRKNYNNTFTQQVNLLVCSYFFPVGIESIYGICPRILQIKIRCPTLHGRAYQSSPFPNMYRKCNVSRHSVWVEKATRCYRQVGLGAPVNSDMERINICETHSPRCGTDLETLLCVVLEKYLKAVQCNS